jgi:hypothetical protein
MTKNQAVVDAAERLSASDLRSSIEQVQGASGNEAHRILPVIWPYINDILTVTDAGKMIAQIFRDLPETDYEDYNPGHLDEGLCRRFSELPQYANAPSSVQRVVRGLGYANVIGIFLAKEPSIFRFMTSGVGPKSWTAFLDWVEVILTEENITRDEKALAAFEKYAALTELLRHVSGHDSFSYLNQPSGNELVNEPIRSTDCDRLLEMGIKTTPDLAQTSVHELARAFAGDEFAMKRLHAFLAKRGLAFGMKFLPQWSQ